MLSRSHAARIEFRGAVGLAWVLPSTVFLIAFFVFPLIHNGLKGFTESGGQSAITNYVRLLTEAYYLGTIAQTLVLSLVVTLISLLLGYPIAYYLVRYADKSANLIIFLLIAPLLTSIVMRTFGWKVLFARTGLVNMLLQQVGLTVRPINLMNGYVATVIGLVHVLIPFMVLSISSVLRGIDRRLEESAQILGANKLQTFCLITLPLSVEGILTGSILVFMLTNGAFVSILLLGQGTIHTLPLLIYQQFMVTRDVNFASAMGNILLVFALVCLLAQLRVLRRRN
jgi:putative spermidine/putrescine transport system permease protein